MAEASHLVSQVICKFRRLNPEQERTIVGLSGGADSIALLYCLSRLKNLRLLAVHVTHDLRPVEQTAVDYEIAKTAATQCGIDFVRVKAPILQGRRYGNSHAPEDDGETNHEAMARRARYAVLEQFATGELASKPGENFILRDRRSSSFIATGHHADDQLETLLMRIGRGTGIAGLRGISESRKHNNCVTVIRPMLEISRADTENICRDNKLSWATDLTNADVSYARNRIRAEVVPVLKALYPNAAEHAFTLAAIASSAQECIEAQAAANIRINYDQWLPEGRTSCYADSLRTQSDVVIHEWLMHALRHASGYGGFDQINYQMLGDFIRAVRAYQTTVFNWPGRIIEVSLKYVTVRRSKFE